MMILLIALIVIGLAVTLVALLIRALPEPRTPASGRSTETGTSDTSQSWSSGTEPVLLGAAATSGDHDYSSRSHDSSDRPDHAGEAGWGEHGASGSWGDDSGSSSDSDSGGGDSGSDGGGDGGSSND